MPDIKELYYITPIENILSIMEHGILCHNEAKKLEHVDISMNEVQERRLNKSVPNGLKLHEYANLYFDAHNPMLSSRRNQNSDICILQIENGVLNLKKVVVADRNASSDYVRFYDSPEGLKYIDFDTIFAQYWTSSNPFEQQLNRSIKCAEVLVPEGVPQNMIIGAYVCNSVAEQKLIQVGFSLPIIIKSSIFF